jgi:hypothetical protein
MAVDLKSVYSSHVAEIGYDGDAQALHVVFKTGKHAVYRGVPADVAERVLSAPSIGEALNESVRGVYGFGYV